MQHMCSQLQEEWFHSLGLVSRISRGVNSLHAVECERTSPGWTLYVDSCQICQVRYKSIRRDFTAGIEYGKKYFSKHMIILNFLIDILHLEPDFAEEETSKIEHSLSDKTVQSMEKLLYKE